MAEAIEHSIFIVDHDLQEEIDIDSSELEQHLVAQDQIARESADNQLTTDNQQNENGKVHKLILTTVKTATEDSQFCTKKPRQRVSILAVPL